MIHFVCLLTPFRSAISASFSCYKPSSSREPTGSIHSWLACVHCRLAGCLLLPYNNTFVGHCLPPAYWLLAKERKSAYNFESGNKSESKSERWKEKRLTLKRVCVCARANGDGAKPMAATRKSAQTREHE